MMTIEMMMMTFKKLLPTHLFVNFRYTFMNILWESHVCAKENGQIFEEKKESQWNTYDNNVLALRDRIFWTMFGCKVNAL